MTEQENLNQLMIITRCLSPPMDNPRETIYSGRFLKPEEVSKKVNLGLNHPNQYWYTISELAIKKEDKDNNFMLNIRETHVDYGAILKGYNNIGAMNKEVSTAQISLGDSAKKGLMKLIEMAD